MKRAALLLTLLMLPGAAVAQHEAPLVTATRIAAPPKLDGVLDDTVWSGAEATNALRQVAPVDGARPTHETRVRFLFDGSALFVGAEMDGPVVTRMGRRDAAMAGSDWLVFRLDSYHEHTNAFELAVNPSGVRRDNTINSNGEKDSAWDPIWEVVTARTASGWSFEARVPLASLRYRVTNEAIWGLAIERVHAAIGEQLQFPHRARSEPGGIPFYAHLGGFGQLPNPATSDVEPFIVAKAASVANGVSAGVDIKRSIGRNVTMTAAVNPDFGQVEADPATINLSAFELQFAERRSFFVEDADFFRISPESNPNRLVYTRRVGAIPPVRLANVKRQPEAATIAGAAKLMARGSGWTFGVMDAVTTGERAAISTENGESSLPTASTTNFLALRALRGWSDGAGAVSVMATAVNRQRDSLVSDLQRDAAYVLAADGSTQWSQRRWGLNGFVALSRVRGSAAAMIATQRSSARYYQRPDASHLQLDSVADHLDGVSVGARLSRHASKHFQSVASVVFTSPGFEINDLGFQRRADVLASSVMVVYRHQRAGGIRDVRSELAATPSFNAHGEYLGIDVEIEGTLEFANRWQTELELGYNGGGFDDRLTRGGPMMPRPDLWSLEWELRTDDRKPLSFFFELQADRGPRESRWNLYMDATVIPAPRVRVTLLPDVTHARNDWRFIRAIPDSAATATYGERYVFMRERERSASVAIRVSYVLATNLTCDLWARPFRADVNHDQPVQLVRPRTTQLRPYEQSVVAPDFDERKVQASAVMRWEWRPGSTFYLAWQKDAAVLLKGSHRIPIP